MKKVFIFGTLIMIFIILTGCNSLEKKSILPKRVELNKLEAVRAIGVDKSPANPGHIRVTITSMVQKPEGSTDEGGKQDSTGTAAVAVSDGKTAFEAARMFQISSERQTFWGYAEYYLIGEAAARENLLKYLDFPTRGQQLRLDLNIYVVKNMSAEEMLLYGRKDNFFVGDPIKNLTSNIGLTSASGELRLLELMGMLDEPYSDALIPVLQADDSGIRNKDGVNIALKGYAFFKNAKLAGYTDLAQTLGINFLTGRVESAVIIVKDSTGEDVTLEVISAQAKVKPVFNGTKLKTIKIVVDVESNIAEQQSERNIYEIEEINRLEERQRELVNEYVKEATKLTQKEKIDILRLGERIYHRHPVKWQYIKENWRETLSETDIEIEVNSRILKTYNIRQPNAYNEE